MNTQVAYQISEAHKMDVERKSKKSERPTISNQQKIHRIEQQEVQFRIKTKKSRDSSAPRADLEIDLHRVGLMMVLNQRWPVLDVAAAAQSRERVVSERERERERERLCVRDRV